MKKPPTFRKDSATFDDEHNAAHQALARDIGPENMAERSLRPLGLPFEVAFVTFDVATGDAKTFRLNHECRDRGGLAFTPDSWIPVDNTANALIRRPSTPIWTSSTFALRVDAVEGGRITVALFRRN